MAIRLTAVTIVLLFLGYTAWRVLVRGGAAAGNGPDDILLAPSLALAGVICLLAGRSPVLARRQSFGWLLVGGAWILSALGLILWALRPADESALASLSNVVYSSYYLAMIPGLMLLAAFGPGWLSRARAMTESAIIVAAVVTFDWYCVLRFGITGGTWTWLRATGIVVGGEFLLVLLASLLLHRPRALGSERAAQLLALGTLVAAIADLIYENGDIQVFAGYQLGADLALAFAAALIAGAGLRQLGWPGEPESSPAPATDREAFDVVTITALGLVAGATLLEAHSAGEPDSPLGGLAVATVVIGALLSLRVVLTRRELHAEAVLRAAREDALRQSQQMESLGRLAGGVAHDFNNLLAVVLGNAELIRPTLPSSAGREELDEIVRAAQSGATLSRQLLALSRPAPEGEIVVDLHAETMRLQSVLARLLPRTVTMEVTGRPGVARVTANPARLDHVLLNLALNARDAISGDGQITIALDALAVGAGSAWLERGIPEGRYAMLAVRDDGAGMEPEVAARAFEPFFTTKGARGNGLGLATVHAVVRALGGHARVDSRPGQGTVITLLFPLADAPVTPRAGEAAPEAESPAPGTTGGVILLVDDEPSVRRILGRLLERSGYEVVEAVDGEDALRTLEARDWRVDLVLTDMLMPVMTGDELVRRIRARRPELPVLCMSGHLDSASPVAGEPWSGDQLIPKPCTSHVLLARVADAIG